MSQIIKKINLILDTDTYNECDGQFALSYLIKSKDLFNIEAITVAPYSHIKRDVTVRDEQELRTPPPNVPTGILLQSMHSL